VVDSGDDSDDNDDGDDRECRCHAIYTTEAGSAVVATGTATAPVATVAGQSLEERVKQTKFNLGWPAAFFYHADPGTNLDYAVGFALSNTNQEPALPTVPKGANSGGFGGGGADGTSEMA